MSGKGNLESDMDNLDLGGVSSDVLLSMTTSDSSIPTFNIIPPTQENRDESVMDTDQLSRQPAETVEPKGASEQTDGDVQQPGTSGAGQTKAWPHNLDIPTEQPYKRRRLDEVNPSANRSRSPNPDWFDKVDLPKECKEIYLKMKAASKIRARYIAHERLIDEAIQRRVTPRSMIIFKKPPLGLSDQVFMGHWNDALKVSEADLTNVLLTKCKRTIVDQTTKIDQHFYDLGKYISPAKKELFQKELESYENYFIGLYMSSLRPFHFQARGRTRAQAKRKETGSDGPPPPAPGSGPVATNKSGNKGKRQFFNRGPRASRSFNNSTSRMRQVEDAVAKLSEKLDKLIKKK